MTTTPLASFVVTCHNLGAYLDETVASLLCQTSRDFEIVVVNDGSTDEATCRLLADYQRDRTRVVHSERRGLPGARNLGVAHSRGSFLCMVDADDLLEPSYLERSLGVLRSDPQLAFASHWLRAFGDETWEWTPSDWTVPALLVENTLNGAALIRRDVFEREGGFDESFVHGCEDWEFWIRLVTRGYRGTIIPEFLFRYRRRADSMSRRMHRSPGMAALHRQLIAAHPQVFEAHLMTLLERRDLEIASLSRRFWQLMSDRARTDAGARWARDNLRLADEVRGEVPGSLRARLEGEIHRLHADYHREAEAAAALRDSWSWRLTAPLRALVGWVRR